MRYLYFFSYVHTAANGTFCFGFSEVESGELVETYEHIFDIKEQIEKQLEMDSISIINFILLKDKEKDQK